MLRRARSLFLLLLVTCRTSVPAPLFEFHSNFWLNLHHFVRAVGRGFPVNAEMSAEDRAVWDRAVGVYRAEFSNRDLLFDEGMVAIKNALRNAGESLEGVAIPADLRATLEEVAPVYRRHFWNAHDGANRAWIENVKPLLRAHGAKIAPQIAAAYGETWPREPIPVDITVTAGPNGAYTTYPPHVTIGSMDHPGNRGLHSLEIVFHESSHQWGRRLSRILAESAQARGKMIPRDLWHAVLFYNAAEITRRVLADAGIAYDAYGGEGLYTALCGDGCRARVAAAWNAHLDGSASMEEALDRLVASF